MRRGPVVAILLLGGIFLPACADDGPTTPAAQTNDPAAHESLVVEAAASGPVVADLGPVFPGAVEDLLPASGGPGGTPGGAPVPAGPTGPLNVYEATLSPVLGASVADVPHRVYVPNSGDGTVTVIDPATYQIVDQFPTGTVPHHVTPAWDLSKLYVDNTSSDTLTVIDPRSAKPTETIPVIDPYNLYFTLDGSKAIVVAERYQRLDFRDPNTWELLKSVAIPWLGVDHLDFSADGRYLMASTEFSGQVVKVDTERMEVVGTVPVGSLPIDVKVSPDGTVFYVANQGRHGVSIIDPEAMQEIGFLPTGKGAHGLSLSRDATVLYVSNRLAGTMSVIDLATRQVQATWAIGGSPDMISVNPDGSHLWVSNRFHSSVSVVDTATGQVVRTIPTGAGAHGVTYFPQPGRYSIGHNGVYR